MESESTSPAEVAQSSAPAPPPVPVRPSARTRAQQLAARVSVGLSLTMLATPLYLAVLPPAPNNTYVPVSRAATPPASAGQALVAGGKPLAATEVTTRSVPVVEVKSRRDLQRAEPPRSELPIASLRETAPSPAREMPPPSQPSPTPPAAKTQAPPASSPAPALTEQAGPPPPPPTWSEAEVATALKACLKTLAPLNVELEVQQPVRDNACGLPAPVSIRRIGPDHVEFQPPILVNCAMASALHDWLAKVAQPAARDVYGSSIVKLSGTSGYACRNRNGAKDGPISEHAFGNAVDIAAVVLADGRSVAVLKDWGPIKQATKTPAPAMASAVPPVPKQSNPGPKTAKAAIDHGRSALGGPTAAAQSSSGKDAPPEPSKESTFLKRLHGGACGIFGTVLGPDANEAHRDHLHFDLKARRRSGICE